MVHTMNVKTLTIVDQYCVLGPCLYFSRGSLTNYMSSYNEVLRSRRVQSIFVFFRDTINECNNVFVFKKLI